LGESFEAGMTGCNHRLIHLLQSCIAFVAFENSISNAYLVFKRLLSGCQIHLPIFFIVSKAELADCSNAPLAGNLNCYHPVPATIRNNISRKYI